MIKSLWISDKFLRRKEAKSVFFKKNFEKRDHFRLLYLKLIFHPIGQNFS